MRHRKKRFILLVSILLLQAEPVAANENRSAVNMVLEKEIMVIRNNTEIRTGTGDGAALIRTAQYGDVLEVLGMAEAYYIVWLPEGTVGVIPARAVMISQMGEARTAEGGSSDDENTAAKSLESPEESLLFSLVNLQRVADKRQPFEWDEKLNRIARIKAEDMALNESFGHYSYTYGTPYQMLRNMQVTFRFASENIAIYANEAVLDGPLRNEDSDWHIGELHAQMMEKSYDRANILSGRFTKMGIGIAQKEGVGLIVVELFVEE